MRHVIFRVEKERYGLPLSSVREVVVPPERFTRVPRAPAAISGVMNLRGRVVTVVEMRQLLGLPGQSPPSRVLLLDRGRRDLGFLVTDVDGIEALERVSTAAPGKAVLAVRGVARLKGLGVTVLDPEGLDAAVVALFTPQK
ncbi:chemotaxis protein CheW [Hyalangium gracile]|uniref:chemotaxis protein CheW n=1 Tax=Hyalangium gracile TaxID=394092 RepID=UPI001CCC3E6F|nr:chemotaxis protein CheW [Hyalangium gracile]